MMTVDDISIFRSCVTEKRDKNGVTIACKKGLWSVTAPTAEVAVREALYYWQQYYADGEYTDKEAGE